MDTLLDMIPNTLAGLPIRQWLLVTVIGLSATTLFWALALVAGGNRDPYRKQLKQIQEVEAGKKTLEQRLVVKNQQSGASGSQRIRTLLVHAGFQNESAYRVFVIIRLVLLAGAVAAGLVLLPRLTSLTFPILQLATVGVAYMAWLAPVVVVEHIADRRMTRMKIAMPDALDLLVVCTEAGMGFKAALQRVAEEVRLNHATLAEELALVSAKLRAGLSMQQAFEEFILRTGLEEFRSLNVAINQSMQLGTSISETLRVFSDEYRIKRRQEAEEMAAKIGTKLIFPLVLLIWPSFFIVAVGPAILKVFRAFAG